MSIENTQIYIELYSYKQAWVDLPSEDRQRFVSVVENAIAEIEKAGVKVIGFGLNDTNTDRRAAYDFFCVYEMPSAEFARLFEQQVEASGWYNYFEQINVSGTVKSPSEILAENSHLSQ
ncbi:hypothetical protein EYS14_06900 [Alteromonadaceae bacterium M269]|nr:hypothetical protein EYS14_06900 [Alteromonadaceae bacterium M269]